MKNTITLFIFALLLSSCAEKKPKYSIDNYSTLEGLYSAEVESIIGEPDVVADIDGYSKVYTYKQILITNFGKKCDLFLYFDGVNTGRFTNDIVGTIETSSCEDTSSSTSKSKSSSTSKSKSSSTSTSSNKDASSITDQDGNTYDYLTYGDQVWTVENAEMVTYRDGTPIPQVTDNAEWRFLTTGAWAYYNNDPTKPRLYNWYAVMGIHDNDPNTPNKEFAPEGWHVPSDAEWTTLEDYLIANGYNYDQSTTENKIAKSIASTTGWNSSTYWGAIGNDQRLNNSSGFNAYPEGSRNWDGSFNNEGYNAFFWSSTENFSNYAWEHYLNNHDSDLARSHYSFKLDGFSVRFVRD